MRNTAQRVISTGDTAVKLSAVSKRFIQWQRSGKIQDILRNLVKPEKKEVIALNQVSIEVKQGEFLAYAGANGAGKSTTLKLLSGILQPSEGEITVLGLNPALSRIELMRRIGIVFGQRTELWWDQPIAVSFDWKRVVWDIPKATYQRMCETVIELLDLGSLMNTFARELSLGQRMRADLGLMLLHEPELILLDEPTLGLDVLAKQQMIHFLKHLNREQGTTIVVTSHDMDDLEEMARRIILLSHGDIAFDGCFDQLRELTGSMRRILLTTKSETPPELSSARLIASSNCLHEYEFDSCRVSVKQLLEEVSNINDIVDIETGKAPIEQVIAELYREWRLL